MLNQEGLAAEKGSAAEIGDTRSDTSQDSQHCLKSCVTPGAFPRFLAPFPWLAGILQAVPALSGSRQPGTGHGPPAQVLPAEQRLTENTWRSNEWQQELSLSQEEQVPNAAKECP